jgi:hypothetical protein
MAGDRVLRMGMTGAGERVFAELGSVVVDALTPEQIVDRLARGLPESTAGDSGPAAGLR